MSRRIFIPKGLNRTQPSLFFKIKCQIHLSTAWLPNLQANDEHISLYLYHHRHNSYIFLTFPLNICDARNVPLFYWFHTDLQLVHIGGQSMIYRFIQLYERVSKSFISVSKIKWCSHLKFSRINHWYGDI